MFAPRNIALYAELLNEAEEKVAMTPLQGAGAALAGVGAAAIPAGIYLKQRADKDKRRTRDLSFGAGIATGIATPLLLKKLLHIANERGLVPSGALESG